VLKTDLLEELFGLSGLIITGSTSVKRRSSVARGKLLEKKIGRR